MNPVLPSALSGCLSLLALSALVVACDDGGDGSSFSSGTSAAGGLPANVGTGGVPVTGTGGVAGGSVGGVPGSGGAAVSPRVGNAILIQPDYDVDDSAPIGFAFGTRNVWGINGPAYTFHDEAGSTISGYVPEPRSVCSYGTVAAVDTSCGAEPSCWAVYWGAGWGLNVNQARRPGPDDIADPQPLDLSGIESVTFDIEGPEVPPYLWLTARIEGDDAAYCAPVYEGYNDIYLGGLRRNCWDSSEQTYVDRSKIWAIQIHVATIPEQPIYYDYCVTDLSGWAPVLLK